MMQRTTLICRQKVQGMGKIHPYKVQIGIDNSREIGYAMCRQIMKGD